MKYLDNAIVSDKYTAQTMSFFLESLQALAAIAITFGSLGALGSLGPPSFSPSYLKINREQTIPLLLALLQGICGSPGKVQKRAGNNLKSPPLSFLLYLLALQSTLWHELFCNYASNSLPMVNVYRYCAAGLHTCSTKKGKINRFHVHVRPEGERKPISRRCLPGLSWTNWPLRWTARGPGEKRSRNRSVD